MNPNALPKQEIRQIGLDELKLLQRAGRVMEMTPSSWEHFQTIPPELVAKWKAYLDAKLALKAELAAYDIVF